MTNDLQGTVALVTGASSGIGEATALRLASLGAAVAIAARRKPRLDRLALQIEDAGGRALAIEADVTDRMVALNVQGLLYVAHAALPQLLHAADDGPRRVADLVNISSVAGRVARSGSGVYNLTKHGVGAFSESLRQEVTRRHVRVSLVEPGAVATELTDHLRDEAREQLDRRFGDMERMQADDIADAIAYVVTRPRRVAINEVLIRPTEQEG